MRILGLLLIGWMSLTLSGQSAGSPKQSSKPPFTLFISSRRVFTVNTPVEVKVRVINISSHDINASTGNIKGFAYGYTYNVRDANGLALSQKQIDATHQSSAQIVILKPGQSRDEITNMSEAYDLSPGKYTIQLSMPSSSVPGMELVKSNTITIAITNGDSGRWLGCRLAKRSPQLSILVIRQYRSKSCRAGVFECNGDLSPV